MLSTVSVERETGGGTRLKNLCIVFSEIVGGRDLIAVTHLIRERNYLSD